MRLPETKIKEAILHPEKLIRLEALLYFTDCYSRDVEVMPLAIKAIETDARLEAQRLGTNLGANNGREMV